MPLSQLEQQTARRECFELARRSPPVPPLAQLFGHSMAAPLRMLVDQKLKLDQFTPTQRASLHAQTIICDHPPRVPEAKPQVPQKMHPADSRCRLADKHLKFDFQIFVTLGEDTCATTDGFNRTLPVPRDSYFASDLGAVELVETSC